MDKSQLYKVPLKYGLAGGIIAIILFCVLYILEAEPLASIRVFDFILLPIFVFFSLKELRDYKWNGKLLYWEGMTAGFICYALIALLSSLCIWLFLTQIDPALFVQYIQENIAILTDDAQAWVEQLGQEDYDRTLEGVRETTPFTLAADDFLKKLLIGVLVTSLISLFLKRSS